MELKTEIAHITTPVAKYTLDFNTGVIKAKPIITHGDSIRSMTDEELADKFEEIQLNTVKAFGNDDLLLKGELKKYWLDWMKEEVRE